MYLDTKNTLHYEQYEINTHYTHKHIQKEREHNKLLRVQLKKHKPWHDTSKSVRASRQFLQTCMKWDLTYVYLNQSEDEKKMVLLKASDLIIEKEQKKM